MSGSAALEPIEKRSLRDEAYFGLRQAIVGGRLRPGDQLTEPQLTRQFQISRSPIREALGRLEHEGFVVRRGNGRVFVAPLDESELEQLYVVRANSEGLAAQLAAPQISDVEVAAMEAHIEEMHSLAASGDLDGSLRAGEAFHDVILHACGNGPLVEIISGLRLRISRFRALIASSRDQESRASEHCEILAAMRDREPRQAREAMERHITESANSILRSLHSAAGRVQRNTQPPKRALASPNS